MSEVKKEIQDFMNNYSDESSDIKSEIQQFMTEQDPTFEEQYLQPIYNVAGPVAKGLSILGKPVSVAGAAGRTVGKFISGQEDALDPLKSELSTVFPTPEGNPLAGLETIDGLGEPLITAPQGLKEQTPKLSAAIEGMSSPASIAQVGVDALGMAVPAGALASKNTLADKVRRFTAEAYLNAAQKESSLAGALKSSGKWSDVVDYVTKNKDKLVTPIFKEKALDYLEGPYKKKDADEFGIIRTVRDKEKGEIGRLSSEASKVLEKIKADKILDPSGLRTKAYSSLDSRLLGSQESSAQKIIDDAIPQLDFDLDKLNTLKKVDQYGIEDDLLSSQIKKEVSNIEGLLRGKQNELPLTDVPPRTRDYVTQIDSPIDPVYAPNSTKNRITSEIVSELDNPDYIDYSNNIKNQMNLIRAEIESVNKLEPESVQKYAKLKSLVEQRDELSKFFNENYDPSLMSVGYKNKFGEVVPYERQADAYKAMIQERGMLPAGFATELRQQANKLIDGAKLTAVSNPVEAGSLHEAGMALHKAAADAEMNIFPQYLDFDEQAKYMNIKRQQELALTTKELLDKTRLTRPSGGGSLVPVGSLDRGILREVLSTLPEYGGPMVSSAMDIANKYIVNPSLRTNPYIAAPTNKASQIQSQPQPSRQPQSIIDIIPRGVPLSDPMMKAAASEFIIKDKSNHPARNADRIMKLMNEGIFED